LQERKLAELREKVVEMEHLQHKIEALAKENRAKEMALKSKEARSVQNTFVAR